MILQEASHHDEVSCQCKHCFTRQKSDILHVRSSFVRAGFKYKMLILFCLKYLIKVLFIKSQTPEKKDNSQKAFQWHLESQQTHSFWVPADTLLPVLSLYELLNNIWNLQLISLHLLKKNSEHQRVLQQKPSIPTVANKSTSNSSNKFSFEQHSKQSPMFLFNFSVLGTNPKIPNYWEFLFLIIETIAKGLN